MEIQYLKYFYQVAVDGGFTKASKSLNIQQPAISKMVQKLEDDLGFQLLERKKRGILLTKVGEEVFERCQRIFGEINQLENYVKNETKICSGPLKFCAAEPIAAYFVPSIHKKYLAEHPLVYPLCQTGTASELLRSIQKNNFEFGLFFHMPSLKEDLKLIDQVTIPFDLVIASREKKTSSVIESFIGSREIDDTQTKHFPTLKKLQKKYKKAKITISSNSLSSHYQMVKQGLGVSILPRQMVQKDLQSGVLSRLLPKEDFRFRLKIVTRKNAVLSQNARVWLDLFLNTYGSLG